jgi:hypothetical protein
MLDRKALLILPIFILVTLAGAIWQVMYMARGMAPFVIPVSLAFAAAALAYQARRVTASPEALAAWKKWGSFFLISCAAILTAFQLLPIIRHLGIPLAIFRTDVSCAGRGLRPGSHRGRESGAQIAAARWAAAVQAVAGKGGRSRDIASRRLAAGLVWIDHDLKRPIAPASSDLSADGIAGVGHAGCDFGEVASAAEPEWIRQVRSMILRRDFRLGRQRPISQLSGE